MTAAQFTKHRSCGPTNIRPTQVAWQEGTLALPKPFTLESGEVLADAQLAWSCVGPTAAPIAVVLGGISSHRRPCANDGSGWWESQCGIDKALDIRGLRLLSVDWLGGRGQSSGPGGEPGFPAVSTGDQARALLLLLNRLGVRRVRLIVGASYGGNVAQQLAALLGNRLDHLIVLCAAHRSGQFARALRHVQRRILDLVASADRKEALALARSLAVLNYRTPSGIEERFGNADGADVIAWLAHHGDGFACRGDAESYRCLGASLDSHQVDPASIRVPTTLFGVVEDLNVPIALLREYAVRAERNCRLVEVSSGFGHDAFLKEDAIVAGVIAAALEESR